MRFLRMVCLVVATMACASARADSTALIYDGPTELVFGRTFFMRAVAFTPGTGVPLTGATITFTLGGTTATATTHDDGFASAFMTVTAPSGNATLQIAFAGDVFHAAAAKNVPVTVAPQPSAVMISADRAIPAGYRKTVVAELVDADTGAPIPAKMLRFSLASTIVDALGNGSGIATTSIYLPSTTPAGNQPMTVTFSGDTDVLPSSTSQSMFVFIPSPFVIWGGNAGGVQAGDHVMFLAPDWSKQVTGGDYHAAGEFKGFVDTAQSLIEPCGTSPCWTAKAGDARAPATQSMIGVLVSTRISRTQNRISGNVSNIAVIAVDPNSTALTRSGTVLYIAPVNQPE